MKRGFNNESKTGMKERKKRKWQKTKNTEAIKKKTNEYHKAHKVFGTRKTKL